MSAAIPDPSPAVPSIRDDVAVKRRDDRLWIEDPARRVRVPIDAETLRLLEVLADGPRPPASLAAAAAVEPARARERVRLLTENLILDTPRAADQVALHKDAAGARLWPREAVADAPLRFPTGLRHGCVACGACCHGTDVGPLRPEDIARVREIDWTPHLPEGVVPDDWLSTVTDYRGAEVTLMGSRHGRCVFLGEDKLCVIHRVAGAAQKPTICRQFPYTFTRTPSGVDVSFSMECRAWWQAKQAGGPVEADEAGIRALMAQGGPVVDLPVPIPLWYGLDLGLDAWLALREEALDGVRAAADAGAMATALAAVFQRAFDDAMQPYRTSEMFIRPAAWGIASSPGTPGPAKRFLGDCSRATTHVDESLGALRDGFHRRGDPAEGDRAERLRWTLTSLLSGRRVVDLLRFEGEAEVWRDMALAALYAHEPARRDYALFGAASVILRLLGGTLLAGMTAQTGLRGRTSEQDVGDAMVLLTKELRGSAYAASLARIRREVVATLLCNARVFVDGSGPIAVDPLITGD